MSQYNYAIISQCWNRHLKNGCKVFRKEKFWSNSNTRDANESSCYLKRDVTPSVQDIEHIWELLDKQSNSLNYGAKHRLL